MRGNDTKKDRKRRGGYQTKLGEMEKRRGMREVEREGKMRGKEREWGERNKGEKQGKKR